MQAAPVQRAIVSFTTTADEGRDQGLSGLFAGGNGVVACAVGVGPNGFWDTLKDIGRVAIPIVEKFL
jgi:hypothetical protein